MQTEPLTITPRKCGFLHLTRHEIVGLVTCSLIFFVPLLIIWVLNFYSVFVFVAALYLLFAIAHIWPSYRRASFIRNGGKYLVYSNYFEQVFPDGEKRKYKTENRKLSIRKKRRTFDLYFGGTLSDFIGYFGEGKNREFGMFNISNLDEPIILSVLSGNKL